MPDREFKVMIIKILAGLEKRLKDISETLNEEIKKKNRDNTILEIKTTTTEEINNMLEKAKEQINDLEKRVMESNKAEQFFE